MGRGKFSMLIIFLLTACIHAPNDTIKKIQICDETSAGKQAISNFKIIPLEITGHCVLNTIQKLEVADSVIIIQDINGLYAFDLYSGQYLHSYGEKGNGNMEYITLCSFYIDNNKNVNLIDGYKQRILTFNLGGEFICSHDYKDNILPLIQHAVELSDKNIFTSKYIYNTTNTFYSLIDAKNKKEVFTYKSPMETDNTEERIGIHPFSIYKDSIHLILPFKNYIYKFNGEGIIPIYEISTNKTVLSDKEIEDIKNFNAFSAVQQMYNGIFPGFTDIYETSNYILLAFHDITYYLIDKVTLKCIVIDALDTQNIEYAPLFHIHACHNDWLIGVIGESEFLTDSYKDKFVLSSQADETAKRFIDVLENINPEGNPTLLFYRLK